MGWIAGVAAAAALAFMPHHAFGADGGHEIDARRVVFDVPAQSLDQALLRFMEVSKVSVIADSPLTVARRSAELNGTYSAEQGLRRLLAGTGLYARAIGERAFALEALLPGSERQPLPRYASYSAAVQQAVITALCRQIETRPTHYRVVMRLWLGQAGHVTRVELDSSTGSQSLDGAILRALQSAAVAEPLPVGLPQPVKLAILPREGATDTMCASAEAGAASMPAAPTIRAGQ